MADTVGGATHQVHQAELEQQNAELKTRWSSLTENGERIKSELVRLEGAWVGNASAAFTEAANTWISGYNEVLTALQTLTQHVGSANEQFASDETSRASTSTGSWT
jgi:WXG100 family type VII secretion target